MKKIFCLLVIALIYVQYTFVQSQPLLVNSGSLQFSFHNSRNKIVESIKVEGLQKIEENRVENLLIVNLYPGEYFFTINYIFHGVLQTARERFFIEPGKRVIVALNDRNYLTFSSVIDNSSIPLVANDFDLFGQNNYENRVHGNRINHNEDIVVAEPIPISDYDLSNIIETINEDTFNKMQILKSSTDYYPLFTSNQVKQLANLFTYENDKLECVKYLAVKVIDRQNLALLSSIFKYSSTKTEYLNYINTLK